jgi:hypothetical protein
MYVYALVVLDLYTENALQLFAELKLYVSTHDNGNQTCTEIRVIRVLLYTV